MKYELVMPDNDPRTARVVWSEQKGDVIVLCIYVDQCPSQLTYEAANTEMSGAMNESDRERIEWCVSIMRSIADLGRTAPLGDMYPLAVHAIATLKRLIDKELCDDIKRPVN